MQKKERSNNGLTDSKELGLLDSWIDSKDSVFLLGRIKDTSDRTLFGITERLPLGKVLRFNEGLLDGNDNSNADRIEKRLNNGLLDSTNLGLLDSSIDSKDDYFYLV